MATFDADASTDHCQNTAPCRTTLRRRALIASGVCVTCSGALDNLTRSARRCDACLDKSLEVDALRRARNIARGLCVVCAKPPLSGLQKCAKHHAADRSRASQNIEQGRCPCGQLRDNPTKQQCVRCRIAYRGKYAESRRRSKLAMKERAMAGYGGAACSCCGERELLFLHMDHIDNNGGEHRRALQVTSISYSWYIKNNFPSGFQVLCANCHIGKKWRDDCVHRLPFDFQKMTLAERRAYRSVCKRKLAAMAGYGGAQCKCCGETELRFLQMDHINNDGAKHRHELGTRAIPYTWFPRNGFPPGFQVLCANCNAGKKANKGVCPHTEQRGAP